MKISIKTFNKSIEHLQSQIPTKPIVQSQNQTIKTSNDNKRRKTKHMSSNKDNPININPHSNHNANTNYIINNFTLSTKNLINNQGQTDSNEANNIRKREIGRLNIILTAKDKELENLKHNLLLKDAKIKENVKRHDSIKTQYLKLKEEYSKMRSKNSKLNDYITRLETNERKFWKIKEIIFERKLYIELNNKENKDEGDEDNNSENKEVVLQEFEEFIQENDIELFQYLYPNDIINNYANESSAFTPLTIEPVKSLKRLDIIPKLNFNKLNPKSGSDNGHERDKNLIRDRDKVNKRNQIENEKEQKAKKILINVKPSNGTHKDYLNIQESYHETENIDYDIENDIEHYNSDNNIDKSIIAKNANIPNNSLNGKVEETVKNKVFFTQSHKSKSFSGHLSKMVKSDIYTHIQNKYNKISKKYNK